MADRRKKRSAADQRAAEESLRKKQQQTQNKNRRSTDTARNSGKPAQKPRTTYYRSKDDPSKPVTRQPQKQQPKQQPRQQQKPKQPKRTYYRKDGTESAVKDRRKTDRLDTKSTDTRRNNPPKTYYRSKEDPAAPVRQDPFARPTDLTGLRNAARSVTQAYRNGGQRRSREDGSMIRPTRAQTVFDYAWQTKQADREAEQKKKDLDLDAALKAEKMQQEYRDYYEPHNASWRNEHAGDLVWDPQQNKLLMGDREATQEEIDRLFPFGLSDPKDRKVVEDAGYTLNTKWFPQWRDILSERERNDRIDAARAGADDAGKISNDNDLTRILEYQDAWRQAREAGDAAGEAAAHRAAEEIRARYGYSGGPAGDQTIRGKVSADEKRDLTKEGQDQLSAARIAAERAVTEEEKAAADARIREIQADPELRSDYAIRHGNGAALDGEGRSLPLQGDPEEDWKRLKYSTLAAVDTGIGGAMHMAERLNWAVDNRGRENTIEYWAREAQNVAQLEVALEYAEPGTAEYRQTEKDLKRARAAQEALDKAYTDPHSAFFDPTVAERLGKPLTAEPTTAEKMLNMGELYQRLSNQGLTAAEQFGNDLYINTIQMLPTTIAGLATGGGAVIGGTVGKALEIGGRIAGAAGLTAMGAMAGGTRARELQRMGVSQDEATLEGVLNAGVEILTEYIPLHNLQRIAGGTGGFLGRTAAEAVLGSGLTEGTEELVAGVADGMIARMFGRPDARLDPAELARQFAAGAVMGTVHAGFGLATNKIAGALTRMGRTQEASNIQAEADKISELLEQVADYSEMERQGVISPGEGVQIREAAQAEIQARIERIQENAEIIGHYLSLARSGVISPEEAEQIAQTYGEEITGRTDATGMQALMEAAQRVAMNQQAAGQFTTETMRHRRTREMAERGRAVIERAQAERARTHPEEMAEELEALPEEETRQEAPAEETRQTPPEEIRETPPEEIREEPEGGAELMEDLPTQTQPTLEQAARETAARQQGEQTQPTLEQAARQQVQEPKPNAIGSNVAGTRGNEAVGTRSESRRTAASDAVRTLEYNSRDLRDAGQTAITANWDGRGDLGRYYWAFRKVYLEAETGRISLDAATGKVLPTGTRPTALSERQYLAAVRAGMADRMTISREWEAASRTEVGRHRKAGVDFSDEYVRRELDRDTAQQLNSLARALGVKVEFVERGGILVGDGRTANADIRGNLVRLEKGNQNPVRALMGHEITHRMQRLSPEAYQAFRDYAMSLPGAEKELRETQREYRGDSREAFRLDWAMDELTADYAGRLFESSEELQKFIRDNYEKKNVIQKILDVFRRLAARLTGKEKQHAEEGVRLLEEALKGSEKALKEKGSEDAEARELSDVDTRYSIRKSPPPKKTGVAYKVFYAKNGELYPPMVANPGGEGTPVGVWLDADIGQQAAPSKTGRQQVKAGGKGTQGGSGSLAFRPGWHLGDVPHATQFARLNPETGKKELFPSNFVWAACEYAADVDYQEEAMSYGYTENGKFRHSYAGLPRLPEDGYYRYRTNPKPDTVPWIITGAMKVNRILTDAETDAICRENGVEPMARVGGPLTAERMEKELGIRAGDTNRKGEEESKRGSSAEAEKEAVREVGVEIDEGTESAAPARQSLGSWKRSDYVTDRKAAAKALAKQLKITQKQALDYIDSVNSVAKIIAEDRGRLDYEASPGRSAFVSNVEYGGSIDFSTICKKRRLFTGTIDAIQRAMPDRVLTADEMLKIRAEMKKRGYEVGCGLCYVEGSRVRIGKYTKEFLDGLKAEGAEYVPTMAEMNTVEGQEKIRLEHPETYEKYVKFMNKLAQRKPKLFQMATEYQREILDAFEGKEDSVQEKNRKGGLRLQSFSDFEIIHLIDSMQVIMDMARVGLNGQAYTKQPEFAWALGDTGLKINLSLIAKGVDENGKLIFDDVEGMPVKDAMELRERYSRDVGTVIVVFNDAQLLAALADDRIDFVLPFHRSQWSKAQYDAIGLPKGTRDYTMQQNEKYILPVTHVNRNGRTVKERPANYMPNDYWNFRRSGKWNAEQYLKMCAENNRRPKFHKLLKYNGNGSWSLQPDGSTDGYWKLLIDFKMYDNDGKGAPQKPVKPVFNMEEAENMLREYAGGHGSFPVAQDVVDDFVGGRRFSLGRTTDEEYMDAVKRGDMETAQRMVDEAARKAGYNVTGYHGTDAKFNEFKIGDLGYHIGTEAQARDRLAQAGQRSTQKDREDRIMRLYARIRNPLTAAFDFGDWHGKNTAGMLLETEKFEEGYDENAEEINARLEEIARMAEGPYTDKVLREYLQSLGYDGVEYENQFEGVDSGEYGWDDVYEMSYIAFESNQLKLADPVTYDDDGNVIPLSDRFNRKEPDIRYSLGSATWDDLPEDRSWRYRRDSERPEARNGAAMFADDIDTVAGGYGEYAYSVAHRDLEDINDYMDAIAEAIRAGHEDGSLPEEWETAMEYGATPEEIAAEFDPADIVMSAEAWDNEDVVQYIYEKVFEPQGVRGVKTGNGAFVFDPGIIAREPGLDWGRQFSLGSSRGELLRENELLREKVNYWRSQVTGPERNAVEPKEVQRLAGQIRREMRATVPASEIAERLEKIYNGIRVEGWSFDQVRERAGMLARDIVESSEELDDTAYRAYEGMRRFFRETPLVLSERDRAQVRNYEDFRKRNMGRLRIQHGDGSNVLTVFQEAVQMWPEWFDSVRWHEWFDTERAVDTGEILEAIEEALTSTSIRGANPFAEYLDEAVEDLTAHILEEHWNLPSMQDYQDYRLEAMARRYQERQEKALAKAKREMERRLERQRVRAAGDVRKISQRQEENELRARIIREAGMLTTRLLKGTDKNHIPKELRALVASALDSINLSSRYAAVFGRDGKYQWVPIAEAGPGAEQTKRTQAFEELRKAFEAIREEGEVSFDPMLFGDKAEESRGYFDQLMDMRDIPIGDMDLSMLRTVWQTVRAVEWAVNTWGKTFASEKYQTRRAWAEDIEREAKTRRDMKSIGGSKLLLDLETPYTFFSQLGDSGLELYRMLRNAQDLEERRMEEIERRTKEIADEATVKKWSEERHDFEITWLEAGEEALEPRSVTLTLTTDQIMDIWLLSRRQQARDHLLEGGIVQPEIKGGGKRIHRGSDAIRINETQLKQITDTLTQEQKDVAKELQALETGVLAQWGNEAAMKAYGYEKFGDRDYWTIHTAREALVSTVERNNRNPRSVRNFGLAKNTVPHANNPLDLIGAFDNLSRHATQMITYATWLNPMEDASRIFNWVYRDADGNQTGRTMKGILDRVIGRGSQDYWQNLMTDIQNGIRGETDTSSMRLINQVIGNAKGAAVGANLRVVIQQPTAFMRVFAVMDPRDIAAGLAGNPMDGWKTAQKYAGIAARKANGSFDLSAPGMSRQRFFNQKSGLDRIRDASGALAGAADGVTWGAIWNAAAAQCARENPEMNRQSEIFKERTAQIFSAVIDQTQVVDGILQRSQMMRSGSDIMRQATAFKGEPIMSLNLLIRSWSNYRYQTDAGKRKTARTALGRAAAALVANAVVNALAQSLWDGVRDDDDDRSWLEAVISAFIGADFEDAKMMGKAIADGIKNPDGETMLLSRIGQNYKNLAGEDAAMGKTIADILLTGNLAQGLNLTGSTPFISDFYSMLQGYDITRADADVIADVVKKSQYFVQALDGSGKNTTWYAALQLAAQVGKIFGIPAHTIIRDVAGGLRTVAKGTGNLPLQYAVEKAIYSNTSQKNKKLFETLAWRALKEGDLTTFQRIRADLMEGGITDGKKLDAAMKKAAETEPDVDLPQNIRDLLGIRTTYAGPAEEEEDIFGPEDMTAAMYAQYADQRAWLYRQAEDAVTGTDAFREMDDEAKDKTLKGLWTYADQVAANTKSGDRYEIKDGTVKKMLAATEHEIRPEQYALAKGAAAGAKKATTTDGEEIKGSKAVLAREAVDKLGLDLSAEAREYLYDDLGISAEVRGMSDEEFREAVADVHAQEQGVSKYATYGEDHKEEVKAVYDFFKHADATDPETGKKVSGGKKKKVVAEIQKLDLTNAQKREIYLDMGYSEKDCPF